MKKITFLFAVSLILLIIGSCATVTPQVTRTNLDNIPDYSGRWNENDNRDVSSQMTMSMLSSPWLANFRADEDRRPVIIVGNIRNLSSEHIETQSFIKTIETSITNSGKASVVAASNERENVRDERMEQQSYATDETVKALAQETGADLMLQGSIKSTLDAVAGKSFITYQIDLELVDLETNEKRWMDSMPISKSINRSKSKW